MFLLRCIFWLSVVYASMSWTAGQLAGPQQAGADAGPSSAHLLQAAVDTAASYCARHTSSCLADAARLTALARQVEQVEGPTADNAPVHRIVSARALPLPVPDQRRR